jgi:monofunctional biosynthetic peptidoglycan transglycosylase
MFFQSKITKSSKKKKSKKKSKKKKSVFRRILGWAGKIILGLFILSILLTILYRWVNPPITPLMLIRKITNDAPIRKQWVDIEDISPHLIASAIAAEDNHFLGHRGFDFGAIQKAIDERKTGKRKRGASGISQQTAKNVFLWANQSWVRKGLECYFTVLIELFWSKERIMEVYLNVIETGNGIYGCEMASQIYFHKKAKNLTLRQAALITACYPNPQKWTPSKPTTYINSRASKIAHLTTLIGKISFDKENIQKARKRYEKDKR